MNCRFCGSENLGPFADLGTSPPSNAYLTEAQLNGPEKYYPLRVVVCHDCWLVQTEDFTDAAELFTVDYGYFSAMSASWVEHCRRFVEAAIARFGLGAGSRVVEVAANDGYLLQFVKARGVPCYGVEPTHSTAEAARARGIEIVETFFGARTAQELVEAGRAADLTIANNVLAHVPDINDFAAGFRILLKPEGVAAFEFPHLVRLVEGRQFDTIYHEHFSYLSLTAVDAVFRANGLIVFDVEALPTHGGSLRVFAQRSDAGSRPVGDAVGRLLAEEERAGLRGPTYYRGFQSAAESIKNAFLGYLLDARAQGLTVAAYGAAAKGNTLLNFAGVRSDLLSFVVDRSPGKLGRWTPGARIPIVPEDRLRAARPDRIVILPWNLRDEIASQLSYVREWGARFVVAAPELAEF